MKLGFWIWLYFC